MDLSLYIHPPAAGREVSQYLVLLISQLRDSPPSQTSLICWAMPWASCFCCMHPACLPSQALISATRLRSICHEEFQWLAGEEVNSASSHITLQQSTSDMPLTGQTGFLGVASNVGQQQCTPTLSALHAQMLMGSAPYQAALNEAAAHVTNSPTPGPHFACQAQVT